MNPYQAKKKLSAILIVIAIVIAIIFTFTVIINKSNQKSVTFLPNSNNKIEIGTLNFKTRMLQSHITDSSQQTSIRLRSGEYAVRYSAPDQIAQSAVINLSQNLNLTSPPLDFTASKLSQFVTAEAPAIKAAIIVLPGITHLVISDITLYKHADAATARLKSSPADPEPLSVILQKYNDIWKIVAGPAILISIKEHPAIPADIVRAVNNQQYTTQIK